jgi:hypothetical protein
MLLLLMMMILLLLLLLLLLILLLLLLIIIIIIPVKIWALSSASNCLFSICRKTVTYKTIEVLEVTYHGVWGFEWTVLILKTVRLVFKSYCSCKFDQQQYLYNKLLI